MDNTHICIAGDGGPLVVLQASAVPHWQGAANFEDSLMEGGDVETDYDVICESVGSDEFCIIHRYDREMFVLWDSEFGGAILPPHLVSLGPDTLVLTQCYADEDLPDILPHIQETVARGKPERSVPFHIQDTALRLQIGADGGDEPNDSYGYLDIPVLPGVKQCDVYFIEYEPVAPDKDMVIVIGTPERESA